MREANAITKETVNNAFYAFSEAKLRETTAIYEEYPELVYQASCLVPALKMSNCQNTRTEIQKQFGDGLLRIARLLLKKEIEKEEAAKEDPIVQYVKKNTNMISLSIKNDVSYLKAKGYPASIYCGAYLVQLLSDHENLVDCSETEKEIRNLFGDTIFLSAKQLLLEKQITERIIGYIHDLSKKPNEATNRLAFGNQLKKDHSYPFVYQAAYLSSVYCSATAKDIEMNFGKELANAAKSIHLSDHKQKEIQKYNLMKDFEIQYEDYIFFAKNLFENVFCAIDHSPKFSHAMKWAFELFYDSNFNHKLVIAAIFKDISACASNRDELNQILKEIESVLAIHKEKPRDITSIITTISKMSPKTFGKDYSAKKKELRQSIFTLGQTKFDSSVLALVDSIDKLESISKRIELEKTKSNTTKEIQEYNFWNEYEDYETVKFNYQEIYRYLQRVFGGHGRTRYYLDAYENLFYEIFGYIPE